ncbi:unnamed protein product [Camellia sinensis]
MEGLASTWPACANFFFTWLPNMASSCVLALHIANSCSTWRITPHMESDCQESAVAKALCICQEKRNVSEYGASSRCLQNLPPEGEIQATTTAFEKVNCGGQPLFLQLNLVISFMVLL